MMPTDLKTWGIVIVFEVGLAAIGFGIMYAGTVLTEGEHDMYSVPSFVRGICTLVGGLLIVPGALTLMFSPFIVVSLLGLGGGE